jgi:tripartite-type tricarboxylate transporter receptor subunit TctC
MRLLFGVFAIASTALLPAKAEEWPARQVTVVVPFAAGGTTDFFARVLAQNMEKNFGKPFVIENKAGAGGNIGTTYVAKADPDGYTIEVGTVSSHAINATLYKNLPHDTQKDFQPVSLISRVPNILVTRKDFPANSVEELITYAKANPGKITYGSSGSGTSIHLAAELFKMRTGTEMVHVPYRGSGELVAAMLGGHIDLAFDNMPISWPHAKAGELKALAVTSAERSPAAPDLRTIGEIIPGYEASSWFGVFVPAAAPKPIIDKLASEIKRILELPDVVKRFSDVGAKPEPMTPEAFAKFVNDERVKWADVVKASGAKVD